MKILITGGAGFIGSNFCKMVVDRYPQDNFICLDALTYAGSMDNLVDIVDKPNFKFIKGNICNVKLVDKLFKREGLDVVINFAAESHVGKSIVKPDIFTKTNVNGVQVLLDACKKYGIKRFHQVSTDEVYGSLTPKQKPFTEKSPLNPTTPYSASKAAADMLTMAYHKTYGLPVTISRSTNNYGPNQYPEKLIPLMVKNAKQNKDLTVHGNGRAIRDWVYVEDCCEAIDLIVRQGKAGQIYNIGANCEKTNLEIINLVLKKLKKPKSLIKFVPDRLGQDQRYCIDASKIFNELGWQPKCKFTTYIGKTILWYDKKF